MLYLSAASAISSLVFSVDASIHLSEPSSPASAAIVDTVWGLSPDITLMPTPSFLKLAKTDLAEALTLSPITINSNDCISEGRTGSCPSAFSTFSSLCANNTTLFPCFVYFLILSCSLFICSPNIRSGAPRIYEPLPSIETKLHFLSDENGIAEIRLS